MLLLALLACRSVEDTGPVDADGDGYTLDDCDDQDRHTHPDANEACNGRDDDCDGAVDENPGGAWYVDADGDRWGDEATAQDTCAIEGLVAEAGDCDDADAEVHPGATEWCDDRDQDCDDAVDEGAADAALTWLDGDGDGFGAGEATAVCEPASGTVLNGDDCDDALASVNPSATEWCNGLDDDCDGDADEEAADSLDFYPDGDGDGFGVGEATRACVAPSGTADQDGDCDDQDGAVNPDADELCNGLDDDCDGRTDPADSLDATTWHLDADQDGYGATDVYKDACDQPSGWVDDDQDCDDTDDQTNPDTTWYADTDGDGYGDASVTTTSCLAPSGFVANADDCDDTDGDTWEESTWYADTDGDGYGDSTNGTTTSCTQPSGYAATDDDCDDTDSAVNPGATESCNGVDDDCDGTTDSSTACSGCNFASNGGSNYLFCNSSSLDWSSARSACTAVGYDLVTIDNSTENSWVTTQNSTYSMSSPWIGYNDRASEGTWVWASGSSSTYTNWNSGEPNNSGNEDCTHIYSTGRWNDLNCGSTRYYVCEG